MLWGILLYAGTENLKQKDSTIIDGEIMELVVCAGS